MDALVEKLIKEKRTDFCFKNGHKLFRIKTDYKTFTEAQFIGLSMHGKKDLIDMGVAGRLARHVLANYKPKTRIKLSKNDVFDLKKGILISTCIVTDLIALKVDKAYSKASNRVLNILSANKDLDRDVVDEVDDIWERRRPV